MKKIIKTIMILAVMFITIEVKAEGLNDPADIFSGSESASGVSGTSIKYYEDGETKYYAFCLDSGRDFLGSTVTDGYKIEYNKSLSDLSYKYLPLGRASAEITASDLVDIDATKVRNMLLYAYYNGFGTLLEDGTDTRTGLSFNEYYAVIQFATWHASHGYKDTSDVDSNDGLSIDDDGVIYNWLNDSTNGTKRKALLDELIAAENDVPYIVNLKSNGNEMKPSSDEKYYVSSDFEIVGPTGLTYTVKADGDACVLYNDTCEATQTVTPGNKFQLRVDYSKEPTATATVTSTEFDSFVTTLYEVSTASPNTEFPQAFDNDRISLLRRLQNVVVVSPVKDSFQKTISVSGEKKTPEAPATGIYTGIGLFGLVAACGVYYSVSKKNKISKI